VKIIFDNIIFDLQKFGGISRYWIEITSRLFGSNECFFFNGTTDRKEYLKVSIKESNIPLKLLRYLDFQKKLDGDIFHSSYYRIMKGIKNVVTVHDFTYEYYRKGLAKYLHSYQKKRAIQNAELIICISESTKKDLYQFYPNLNTKVKVIYNGVGEKFMKIYDYKTFNSRVLYVGDRKNYKNFDQLVNALNFTNDFQLDLVGGGKLTKQEILKLGKINFKHHERISDEDLNQLYNTAFALVYPSLYEGFGLPIIEAFKAGCPVICHNGSSTVEIANDCAIVGEISPDFILESLMKLKDLEIRKKLIDRGILEAKNYSWDKCIDQTHKAYKSIL
jgi:glycosyltransferase involved in cell wall biosynthesis